MSPTSPKLFKAQQIGNESRGQPPPSPPPPPCGRTSPGQRSSQRGCLCYQHCTLRRLLHSPPHPQKNSQVKPSHVCNCQLAATVITPSNAEPQRAEPGQLSVPQERHCFQSVRPHALQCPLTGHVLLWSSSFLLILRSSGVFRPGIPGQYTRFA